MSKILFLLIGLFLLNACKTYNEDDMQSFDRKIEAYMKKNNLDLQRSESGLYYKIEEEGEGDYIKYKNIVTFKYKGRLLNGEVFDDQMEEPVTFQVSQLIAAWKEILLEMKNGGKAFLITPPQLAYGDRDLDDIPPHSILIFELEVVEVE